MSSGIGVRFPALNPTDWMWYREFGGKTAVAPAIRMRNRRIAHRALLKAGGLAVLASTAGGGASVLATRGVLHWASAALLASLAVGGFGLSAADVASRALAARHRNLLASSRATRADRIHGTPGEAAPSATAGLLELLLALPGPEIFHGLRLSGVERTMDHAVLCGDAVFFLHSVHGGNGTWEWAPDGGGIAVRTDGSLLLRTGHLRVAAEALRALLGPDVEVIPVVVLHGARTAAGKTSFSPHGVHLLTASAALERIGNTSAYGFGGTPNRAEVRTALMDLLV